MSNILVVYYTRNGMTEALAREICRGVDAVAGMSSTLRTVPRVSAETEASADAVPESGPPYVTREDLAACSGMIIGSPTHFGNMGAPLKYFLDNTVAEWFSGELAGKPAAAFTSTSSLHGGQESTLLSMALPLLHHGMLFVGLPYTEETLSTTTTGGSPYGATHVSWGRDSDALSDDEKHLARALGRRVAETASRLSG